MAAKGKKNRRSWLTRQKKRTWENSRSLVDRLEDRILLSADPLLQAVRIASDSEPSIIFVDAEQQATTVEVTNSNVGSISLDLTSLGDMANQNPLLTPIDTDLVRLDATMLAIELGLGDASLTDLSLSQESDGTLRLGGDGVVDLLFQAPTESLVIRGGLGLDSIELESFSVATADIFIEAEHIKVGEAAEISVGGALTLNAIAGFTERHTGSLDALALAFADSTYSSSIEVDGKVSVSGGMVFAAETSLALDIDHQGDITPAILRPELVSVAYIGASAELNAGWLELTSETSADIEVDVDGGLGVISIDLNQVSRSMVSGGASLHLHENEGGTVLLVDSFGQTGLDARFAPIINDGDLQGLMAGQDKTTDTAGFDLAYADFAINRDVSAVLGDGLDVLTIGSLDQPIAGSISVGAGALNLGDAGLSVSIDSDITGLQLLTVTDQVLAEIRRAELDVFDIEVLAYAGSSADSTSKVVQNQMYGSVVARVIDSRLGASNDISILATDNSTSSALSSDFVASGSQLKGLDIGIAYATNLWSRDILAQIINSDVTSSNLYLEAQALAILDAEVGSQIVAEVTTGESDPSFSMGGAVASNEVMGQVHATTSGGSISVNGLSVQASNLISLHSDTAAGAASAGDTSSALALSFNLIGYTMTGTVGMIADSILGVDSGIKAMPLHTLAELLDTEVTVSGDMTVDARNALSVNSSIDSSIMAEVDDLSEAIAVGAAVALSTNRYTSSSVTRIMGISTGQARPSLIVGGDLSISATDESEILSSSDVSVNSLGGGIAAGALISNNHVDRDVLVDLSNRDIDVTGTLSMAALSTGILQSAVEGIIELPGAISSTEQGVDDGLGMNALVASNTMLGSTIVQSDQSNMNIGGDLLLSSKTSGSIDATNSALTSSSGRSAGVTTAFNSIGWQSQSFGSHLVDGLLGSRLADQDPLNTTVDLDASDISISGDLNIKVTQVPEIRSVVSNVAASEASGGMGFVLATNRIARDVAAEVHQGVDVGQENTSLQLAGDMTVYVSDTSGVSAVLDLAASGSLSSVGALVARNDIRGTVDAVLGGVRLDVGGSLSVLSRMAATITASATGDVVVSEDAGLDSLAASALISSNTILGDSTIDLSESIIEVGDETEILASQISKISASNSANATGSRAASGLIAFNAIGWDAGNLFEQVATGLFSSSWLSDSPASAPLVLDGTHIVSGGGIAMEVSSSSDISADIKAGATGTSGAAASVVLATNLVSSRAHVAGRRSDSATRNTELISGESIQIFGNDTSSIIANVSSDASSDGGSLAVGGVIARNEIVSSTTLDFDHARLEADGDIAIIVKSGADIESRVSGVVEASVGSESNATSLAINGVIATNAVQNNADIIFNQSLADAGKSVTMSASSPSRVTANNTAIVTSDGPAAGVTLAFNTIGMAPSNIFATSIDILLGGVLANESPAGSQVLVTGSNIKAGGEIEVAAGASLEGHQLGSLVSSTVANEATAGEAAASFVLATNLINSRNRSLISAGNPDDLDPANLESLVDISAAGGISVSASDAAIIRSDISLSATSSGAAAVGGVIATNDVTADTIATLDRINLRAGDTTIASLQMAAIDATVKGETVSIDDSGADGLAVNGLIASNAVRGDTSAQISGGEFLVVGDLLVDSRNRGSISSSNEATMVSGSGAVGATLAFNSVGYEKQNILSKTLDAIVGGDLGVELPSQSDARVTEVSLDVLGDVSVVSLAEGTISAMTTNAASNQGSGTTASMVLATNAVVVETDAIIEDSGPVKDSDAIRVGGDLHVAASSASTVLADVLVSASAITDASSLGSDYEADFLSSDGEQTLQLGNVVHLTRP